MSPMEEAWESIRGKEGRVLGDGVFSGYTNPELHELPTGQRFVNKRGAHAQHALNEYDMNRYLNALGVNVPNAALFQHQGKPNMLTQFAEDANPLDLKDRDAVERVRQDFVPHAAIANWDVLGNNLDNVLIGPDGEPTYVDLGGSGPWRGTGDSKGAAWGGNVGELETMQWQPPHTEDVFGDMSDKEMGQSWDKYGGQDAMNDALQNLQDSQTRNIMQERIQDIARRVA